jgi:maltose alpha-D-glucosyltransferase/alpha-amylase
MERPWYKNAIMYTIDIETFADGNGDGIGDFKGLNAKLDYLAGLNINCIWLQPFYPTPNRDHGYDISDYYNIDPRYGTLGDFVEFSQAARDRGIRIIADLVVNHTSVDHPWFQEARRDPDSPYRPYYVWSKEKPAHADEGMVFPGKEKTTWTWDDKAKMFYYHRFYWHQPDLDTGNAAVRNEIDKIIKCWLQLGVSGFRVDALPFIITAKGPGKTGFGDCPEYLLEMRQALSWHSGDAVFMAEANLPPEQVPIYFGEGERVHIIFNFYANQHLFLALARGDASPLRSAYGALPKIPAFCQWANFLRTHDELDLGRLSDDEREDVFRAFGPKPKMQLYNLGIRRRLAPMLGNDRRRIELAHSLMLTLPGTPVLRYGDEIGMGEDLKLEERDSVRTPMQWADARNAGFSSAPEERLVLPVIKGGDLGYDRVNVATQERDPESLLNWVEKMTRLRMRSPEFGNGTCEFLSTSNNAVLAHRCHNHDGAVIALHNLGSKKVHVDVELGDHVDEVFDLLNNTEHRIKRGQKHRFLLDPYGYAWFRQRAGPESRT